MDAKRKIEKKWHGREVCVLEPDDFPDDEEDGVKGSEIFQLGNDISYFSEKIRKGYEPIKGRKL